MLYILTNGIFRKAGTERVIDSLATALNTNHELQVIVPQNKKSGFRSSVEYDVISLSIGEFPENSHLSKLLHRFKILYKLLRIVNRNDTIISFAFDLSVVSILAAGFKSAKTITCEHINYDYHNAFRKLIRKILYRYSRNICVTLTDRDNKTFLSQRINSITIPNFIEYELNITYSNNRFNEKKLLSVGRLVEQKNFHHLISSFYKSNIWKNGWTLNIIGEGPNHDELTKLISYYNLCSFIKIEPPTDFIFEYYKKSSIFCMTSLYEAFPMVLLEAMNFGLPIIAIDCPTGPREIIPKEASDQLIDNFDITAYSSALRFFSDSYEKCLTCSTINKNAVSRYSKERIIAEWIHLIKG